MRRRERGMSLVELVVVVAIVGGILLMVEDLFGTTQASQTHLLTRDRAAQQCGKLLSELRAAGLSSRRIYQDDADGRAYLAAIVAAEFPIVADARLPIVDPAGRLEPDAEGARRTGNVLLLACEDRPLDVQTTAGRRRVDVVRFVAVYPTRRTGRVVSESADRIDLVRVTSRPFADRADLDRITDADERAEVVTALRAAGFTRAWTAGATIDEAFFELTAFGEIDDAPVASHVIDTLPDDPARAMLGETRASVAANGPVLRVPAFARLDEALPDFPNGFEVKIVGLSGGRQVMARLTVVAGSSGGPDAASTTSRIFSVRDP